MRNVKLNTDNIVKAIDSTIQCIIEDLELIKNQDVGLHEKKQSINRIRFLMKSLVTDVVELSNTKFL